MTDETEWGPWIEALIDCNPVTGSLIWRHRPRHAFRSENEYQRWNSRYAHTPALDSENERGYRFGTINGRQFFAHRVVWAFAHGEFPASEIDHIDGNPRNNQINNLRLVTRSENCRNAAKRSDNSSGVTGVNRSGRKWIARIGSGEKRTTLGSFESFDDAVAARRMAERALGYSERHGS